MIKLFMHVIDGSKLWTIHSTEDCLGCNTNLKRRLYQAVATTQLDKFIP